MSRNIGSSIGDTIGGFYRGIGIEGAAVLLLTIVAVGISIAWITIGRGIASAVSSAGSGVGKSLSGGIMGWLFGDMFGSLSTSDPAVTP